MSAVRAHKKTVIYMIMRDRFPDYTAGIDLGKLSRHAEEPSNRGGCGR